jgi:DNA-binding transcriptional ArsR family regulator
MPYIRKKPDIRLPPPPPQAAPAVPDYEIAEIVVADTMTQMKALADPARQSILDLVLERAASTTELAEALGKPKGTVDHHLKVLANAGLVRVVRTRKVRAMTERFWGRTGRTIHVQSPVAGECDAARFVREALDELNDRPPSVDVPSFSTLRHARISADRATEFEARLNALQLEFASTERDGTTVYALLLALYPTDQPVLPEARP